jgi:hypothetical protein
VGVGVQGNKYKLENIDLFVFDIYENGKRLDNNSIRRRCWHTELCYVPKYCDDRKLLSSIPLMVDFSRGDSDIINIPREGLVWRNYEKNISFKVINPDFLLKYAD